MLGVQCLRVCVLGVRCSRLVIVVWCSLFGAHVFALGVHCLTQSSSPSTIFFDFDGVLFGAHIETVVLQGRTLFLTHVCVCG